MWAVGIVGCISVRITSPKPTAPRTYAESPLSPSPVLVSPITLAIDGSHVLQRRRVLPRTCMEIDCWCEARPGLCCDIILHQDGPKFHLPRATDHRALRVLKWQLSKVRQGPQATEFSHSTSGSRVRHNRPASSLAELVIGIRRAPHDINLHIPRFRFYCSRTVFQAPRLRFQHHDQSHTVAFYRRRVSLSVLSPAGEANQPP